MPLKIYKLFNILCFPILGIVFLLRILKGKEDLARFKERLGISSVARPTGDIIWIHATSVGETVAVLPLIQALSKRFTGHILLTTTTIGSLKLLQNKTLPACVIHQLCILESWPIAVKFLNFWKPSLALFMEAEFWPCIFDETAKRCKIISINTRISNEALNHWQFALLLLKETLEKVFKFFPQSDYDAQTLASLGFKNYECFGNLKYAKVPLKINRKKLIPFKKDIGQRKVLLFVSTHPGEEEMAANIYQILVKKCPALLVILIPRHITRAFEISRRLQERGIEAAIHSRIGCVTKSTAFYVVDTMGEVNLFSSIAPITIMGGSFVDIGGHNLIEPTRCGSVVIAGPHMENFKSISEEFKQHKAALFVQDQAECIKAVETLWTNKKLFSAYRKNSTQFLKTKSDIVKKLMKTIIDIYRSSY